MKFMAETVGGDREYYETLSRTKLILNDLSQDNQKLALVIIEAIANQRSKNTAIE